MRSRRIVEGRGFLARKNTKGKYETGARLGFEEKMAQLTATLEEQFAESARLEARIRENFERLG
jgi:hypothetical protein